MFHILTFVAFFAVVMHCANGFNAISRMPLVRTKTCSLYMGGGRSREEQGMSKRQMFRAVRDRIFEAAKLPGFFDVGEGPPDLSLFCKSNRDGTQISDCPDTQFLQLVLQKKKLRYTLHPSLPSKRPAWLVEKHGGQVPALSFRGNESLVGTMAIAEYLEEKYPDVCLTRDSTYTYRQVLEKTKLFFPTLTAFILNKDPDLDADLRANMHEQLDLIDRLLRSAPGRFLCGIEITLADLYLAPQLFHAAVTMDMFKQEDILHIEGEPQRPGLEKYMAYMFGLKEFNSKKCYYNMDQVIYGWRVARGEAQAGV